MVPRYDDGMSTGRRRHRAAAAGGRLALLVLLGALSACADDTADPLASCPAGQHRLPDGRCGVDDPAGCPPGELPRADGSCQPAGLPPDMPCAPGELEVDVVSPWGSTTALPPQDHTTINPRPTMKRFMAQA